MYEFTLRPVLHQIIASQSPTIEVLELFEMENNWFGLEDLYVASNYWTELDNLLDDRSFSHLKEIRLEHPQQRLMAPWQENAFFDDEKRENNDNDLPEI